MEFQLSGDDYPLTGRKARKHLHDPGPALAKPDYALLRLVIDYDIDRLALTNRPDRLLRDKHDILLDTQQDTHTNEEARPQFELVVRQGGPHLQVVPLDIGLR